MEPIIVAPQANEDGTYCAGIRYKWEAQWPGEGIGQWTPVLPLPQGVVWGDVVQTNPLGLINYMTFPVPGNYCFNFTACEKI